MGFDDDMSGEFLLFLVLYYVDRYSVFMVKCSC